MSITIKTADEIQKMKIAGKLAADVLEMIGPMVRVGQKTGELNKICHEYIVNEQRAIPAPLNYHGFPKSICTSVNHVVCHGIPSYKEKLNCDNLLFYVALINLVLELFPIRSTGSFFTTGNAIYIFLMLSILQNNKKLFF